MLTALILAATAFQDHTTYSCAVMLENASKMDAKTAVDYNGVRYPFCCGGCDTTFQKDPAKYAKAPEGKVIGFSLFDPVSGEKIDLKKANELAGENFKGVHYLFANADDAAKFKADPKAYTKTPEKEVLSCVVMGHDVNSYADAGAYVDYKNVRYYMCCTDCSAEFKKDPAKFAEKAKALAKTAKALPVKSKE